MACDLNHNGLRLDSQFDATNTARRKSPKPGPGRAAGRETRYIHPGKPRVAPAPSIVARWHERHEKVVVAQRRLHAANDEGRMVGGHVGAVPEGAPDLVGGVEERVAVIAQDAFLVVAQDCDTLDEVEQPARPPPGGPGDGAPCGGPSGGPGGPRMGRGRGKPRAAGPRGPPPGPPPGGPGPTPPRDPPRGGAGPPGGPP